MRTPYCDDPPADLLGVSAEVVAPGVAGVFKQVVGALGSPGAGEIVGKDLRFFGGPRLQDGRVERPGGFEAFAMGE